MNNPVVVEVLRGAVVESRHRGSVIVVDGDGKTVFQIGDIERPVFPRSAVKAIQALPFVESGAADAYGFGTKELALACASHGGEPRHTELAASMLAAAGLDKDALECGSHWPGVHDATIALARAGGEPNTLHNNCSGKHSAFLCTCRHVGLKHRGYVDADHPFQEMIRETMEAVTGAPHGEDIRAIDGCSIPTYAVPLKNLALGFSRMTTGRTLGKQRAAAAKRLMDACMAEPFYVAGTGKADTRLMGLAPGRIFVKTGAEAVYCAAVPELGFGIALKCDDGTERGSEAMVAAVLARLLAHDKDLAAKLTALSHPAVKTRKGVDVGVIRPTVALTETVRAVV